MISTSEINEEEWGFYAHRLINRMAVFTLPPELISLFKDKVNYVSEHAVDPDKRRYASSYEASRHYIDIDHWGEPPFDNLPRDWESALSKFTVIKAITETDTVTVFSFPVGSAFDIDSVQLKLPTLDTFKVSKEKYINTFDEIFIDQYYSESWTVMADRYYTALTGEKAPALFKNIELIGVDRLSPYGINPYFLPKMQGRLQNAFENKNIPRIISYAAQMGHYIADGHVPLHTTENYDGQLTGQDGLHAFWESRIPELFAEQNFDFFVGKAEYIENKREYFWNIILKSHSYVDSVLTIEKRLRKSWDKGEIYCYDERLNRIVRTECKAYAAAYDQAMDGMVEDRFRASIKAVGSSWYTAWVDAGQPQVGNISDTSYTYINNPVNTPEVKKFQIRTHE